MIGLMRFALALVGGAALITSAAAQAADEFPTRPITLVVPFGAGGTGDVMARVYAGQMEKTLGQPVVVENRTGAGGIVGAQAVAQAEPNGYTILQISTGHIILPSVRDVPYDWNADLRPVFGVDSVPQALTVSASSGITSVAELIDAAKAKSGGLTYGSGGPMSLSHLMAALFVGEADIEAVHVPYQGLAAAMQAVLSREADFAFVNLVDALAFHNAKTARILAITSSERLASPSEVPTMNEIGFPAVTASSFTSYLAPAGTPDDIIAKLHLAFVDAAKDPIVRERVDALGVVSEIMSPAELKSFLEFQAARWKQVIEDNGLQMEAK